MDTNMNKLEQAWKQQDTGEEIDVRQLDVRETHSIIDAVRKNMRMEFYLFLVSPILFAIPFFMETRSSLSTSILVITLLVLLLVSMYYISRFYKFYTSSGKMLFNTKENLTWFYYELRFNMELYRSFVYHGLSIGFFAGFIGGIIEPHISKNTEIDQLDLLLYGIFIVLLLLFTVWITNFWLKHLYGKHLQRVKSLLDELTQPEE